MNLSNVLNQNQISQHGNMEPYWEIIFQNAISLTVRDPFQPNSFGAVICDSPHKTYILENFKWKIMKKKIEIKTERRKLRRKPGKILDTAKS